MRLGEHFPPGKLSRVVHNALLSNAVAWTRRLSECGTS
jgi:hypothetical protein